jgi:hypothetical protein
MNEPKEAIKVLNIDHLGIRDWGLGTGDWEEEIKVY